ncbi:hypothetical protein [Pseudomonas aeruginosa]|uniref:hypothetical protein n=1 Tax=Pseudomonas aeruginosa TaxID=287 RepID=UPI00053F0285|nr:hypothetical protein [Pseudomonas aeruginosa]MCT0357545.1 hypothetical protein [Pseudomonas aeruginosa]MCT0387758.1 hypothetical protein [Pseudomonas aeruginosa]MDY1346714.1 hypothetical protein [Pseudomonas aeruginosa]
MSSNHANGGIRYFVNDTSRKALAAAGRGPAREALESGFREVSQEEHRQFTAENARLLQAVLSNVTTCIPLKEGVAA